jgi:hypothetical protein
VLWYIRRGFALEDDTILSVYDASDDASGALIASNDDIDEDAENYCSQITTRLTPSTYYLAVETSLATGGGCHVHARAGQCGSHGGDSRRPALPSAVT